MSKIMINNVALELDLLDADAMETYQKSLSDTMTALQEAQSNIQGENQNLQVASVMRLPKNLSIRFSAKVQLKGASRGRIIWEIIWQPSQRYVTRQTRQCSRPSRSQISIPASA